MNLDKCQTEIFSTCLSGVSSAVEPDLIDANTLAWGLNVSVRGGKPQTRPPIRQKLVLPSGLVQGAKFFSIQGGMIIVAIAGNLYRVRVGANDFSYESIDLDWNNSSKVPQYWMQETVESLVIQDGQSDPIIYDGSTARRSDHSQSEVPRGRQMAYGNGRLWVARNMREVVAGDIRTSVKGSELKFTETNYLFGGGALYFPNGITAMAFSPVSGVTDYGTLMVFGPRYAESIRADVSSRDLWSQLPGFVTTVLRNTGSAGHWSTVEVNQDLYWRDSDGGLRSLRSAVADESTAGNSPISREVARITDYESTKYLSYCSTILHDNRLLMTASPFLNVNGGVSFKNIVALDFATTASMRGKSSPAYCGAWTGLNFTHLVSGKFNGVNRAFAISLEPDGQNRLWEIGETGYIHDSSIVTVDSVPTRQDNPITCLLEFGRRHFSEPRYRKRLNRLDVYLRDVDGQVDMDAYWRPDHNQAWNLWDSYSVNAKTTDGTTTAPHEWLNLQTQYRPQVKTFTIPQVEEDIISYQKHLGFEFQIRLVWKGKCRIDRAMLFATVLKDDPMAERDLVDDTPEEMAITS